MTPARSQELVVGCLAASAVVTAGSMLADGETPGIRMVLGLSFAGIGLATVSMFSPDLAGAFATLILTTSVFVYGGPLMDLVTEFTASPTTSTTAGPSRPTGVVNT